MNKEFIKWLKAQTYDLELNPSKNECKFKVIDKPYNVKLNLCWGEIIKMTQMNPEFIKWLKEQSYHYMSRKGYILIMTKRSRHILTSSWDEITTYYESRI